MGGGADGSVGSMAALSMAYARQNRGGVDAEDSVRTGMKHELIATMPGSTGFAVTPFVINPGNPTTFPWLSDIAAKWESYRFNYLRFRYETRKGTSTDGSVIMAIDYDARDAPPVSEAVMTTYQGAIEDATWKNSACLAAVSQLHKIGPQKYVRGSTLPTGGSIIEYDAGNFLFGTTAQADTSNIGKLWVDYDVTFFTKQTAAGLSAPANNKAAMFQDSAAQTLANGVAEDLELATASFNGIGAVNTAGSIVLPAGNYLFSWYARARDTSAEAFTGLATINKNSSSIYVASLNPGFVITAPANGEQTLSGSAFVQSDGNDAFTLNVRLDGAAGTLTVVGAALTILAV